MSAARMFVIKSGLAYLVGQRKDGHIVWSYKQSLGRRFSTAEQARVFLRNRMGAIAGWHDTKPVRLRVKPPAPATVGSP